MDNPDQLGALLGWITGVGGLVIGAWTLLGKSKDSSWTRLEGERNRLDSRVGELEKSRDEDRKRLDAVEAELEDLKRHFGTLMDFLRDIVSGGFDLEWIQQRAKDLLERMVKE